MVWDATTATILGIPPYVFFAGIGLLAAFVSANLLCLREGVDGVTFTKIAAFSLLPMLLGAKLVGLIYNIATCLHYGYPWTADVFLIVPIVYYGGLLGFLAGAWFFSRKKTAEQRRAIADILAVNIPLFHALGRCGCFTAGCCYGLEAQTPISVWYTTWVNGAVTSAYRLPIQLIEAGANIILFAVLLGLFLAKRMHGHLMSLYLTSYAVLRLIIECFRAEWDRNVFFGISGSQVISVLLLGCLAAGYLKEKSRRKSV